MFDLIIKNGNIVTKDRVFKGNIGIKDEKIAAIFYDDMQIEAEKVIKYNRWKYRICNVW